MANTALRCTCCEFETRCGHSVGFPLDGKSRDDLEGVSYNGERKSKTLTRVYRPLNDVIFSNSSTDKLQMPMNKAIKSYDRL